MEFDQPLTVALHSVAGVDDANRGYNRRSPVGTAVANGSSGVP